MPRTSKHETVFGPTVGGLHLRATREGALAAAATDEAAKVAAEAAAAKAAHAKEPYKWHTTWWQAVDGCAGQYWCGLAGERCAKRAREEDVIIDRARDPPGHGKKKPRWYTPLLNAHADAVICNACVLSDAHGD